MLEFSINLIIKDITINRTDDEIVKIPVSFRALSLSFMRIKKIIVRMTIKKYIKYKFMRILLEERLQYHRRNQKYLIYMLMLY